MAYTHDDVRADIAAVAHALGTDDPATISAAATRLRSLLNSAGAMANIVAAHRAELSRLLARCEAEMSAHSTNS